MHSHSFQDTELKLHGYVNDSTWQVAVRFTSLPYPGDVRNKVLITQKTFIQRAFAQFSRYKVGTSQVRQPLHATCSRGEIDDSTVPQKGRE